MITGVSSSYYAKYEVKDGVPTYSGGGKFARMTKVDSTVTANDLEAYSDDCLEEADYSFSSGTLKVDVSELEDNVVSDLTGAKLVELTENDEKTKEIIYDDEQKNTELGFGFVVEKKKNGVFSYRAIVLSRIKFKLPGVTATTRGKTLSFQTHTVEAAIHRDHSANHAWKREATFVNKENAIAYIKRLLNLTQNAEV